MNPLSKSSVDEISSAAEKWGFFQIVNHGIPESLIARVQAVGKAFFELPIEEKELYKREGGNNAGYGSNVGISADAKLDWRDTYYNNIVWPVSQRVMSKWPKQPSDFTEVMDEYSKKICKLWEVLMQALCGGLGLANENALDEALGALVINIGDQIEILSNGKYKSIEHRSFVQKNHVRMSWPMFCTPSQNVIISPLKELIDEENPPLYAASSFQEYLEQFFTKGLIGKEHLTDFKNSSA
ncbi:hypothetical protein SUGI_0944780 [Cryptomeria japonica]|nr:hypothetical protein SUGI_0944780 [Cryptomeria japonica]